MSNKIPNVHGEASVQGQNHLAIATRLKLILTSIQATDILMVVYLTIDSQDLFAVGRIERLSPTLRIDNAQSFVSQYGTTATIYTTPVWSAMPDLLAHTQCFLTLLWRLLCHIQDSYYSTHNIIVLRLLYHTNSQVKRCHTLTSARENLPLPSRQEEVMNLDRLGLQR